MLPERVFVQDGKSGAVSPCAFGQTNPEPVGQNAAAANFSGGKPPTQLIVKFVAISRVKPMYATAQHWAPILRTNKLVLMNPIFLNLQFEGERQVLRSMNDLENYALRATDGNIGHVKDFYFDDEAWVIRYFIVDTGGWLSSRKVLISPIAIDRPDWAKKVLSVSITKEQVRNSPDIDTDQPVSRQHEMRYLGYYGYPSYWGGAGLWGDGIYPGAMGAGYGGLVVPPYSASPEVREAKARDEAARHQDDDLHLRSCKAVMDYHIKASDGEIGHVQGLLVDEETWAIRYLIVNTSNWWLGHQVLIAPQWVKSVSWTEATVSVDLTRQAVKEAPTYDSTAQLDRTQEMDIHEHYGRPGYWAAEVKR